MAGRIGNITVVRGRTRRQRTPAKRHPQTVSIIVPSAVRTHPWKLIDYGVVRLLACYRRRNSDRVVAADRVRGAPGYFGGVRDACSLGARGDGV